MSSLSESESNIPKYLAMQQASKNQGQPFQQKCFEDSFRKDLRCFQSKKAFWSVFNNLSKP